MFEATLDPDAHPSVARLLKDIGGMESVDDESDTSGDFLDFDRCACFCTP